MPVKSDRIPSRNTLSWIGLSIFLQRYSPFDRDAPVLDSDPKFAELTSHTSLVLMRFPLEPPIQADASGNAGPCSALGRGVLGDVNSMERGSKMERQVSTFQRISL